MESLLTKLRKAHGLSMRELGRRAGCTHAFIGRVERGQSRPSYLLLHRLARVLEVPDSALLAMFIPSEDAPLPPVKSAAGSSRGS